MDLERELIPAADKNSRRLMIVMHGLGDSMDGYRWLPGELGFPWLNYLLLNAPDPYFGGYSWFDFPGDPTPGVERSYRLLAALLDELRTGGHPTEQTLLFGFSQGCLMTWETGLRYPHLLAGGIGISGFMHQPEQLLKKRSAVALRQRFLITHGTLDPLIPFAAARRQVQAIIKAGVQVTWHEFEKAHAIAGEAELAVIRDFVRRCFEPPVETSRNA